MVERTLRKKVLPDLSQLDSKWRFVLTLKSKKNQGFLNLFLDPICKAQLDNFSMSTFLSWSFETANLSQRNLDFIEDIVTDLETETETFLFYRFPLPFIENCSIFGTLNIKWLYWNDMSHMTILFLVLNEIESEVLK